MDEIVPSPALLAEAAEGEEQQQQHNPAPVSPAKMIVDDDEVKIVAVTESKSSSSKGKGKAKKDSKKKKDKEIPSSVADALVEGDVAGEGSKAPAAAAAVVKTKPKPKGSLFKDGRVFLKDELLVQCQSSPSYFIDMAEYFKSGVISDRLVAMLIPPPSAPGKPSMPLEEELLPSILGWLKQSPSPEFIPSPEILKAKILSVADWVNYGVDDGDQDEHLALYRWNVRKEFYPPELQENAQKALDQRLDFKTKVNEYYSGLLHQDRVDLKRKFQAANGEGGGKASAKKAKSSKASSSAKVAKEVPSVADVDMTGGNEADNEIDIIEVDEAKSTDKVKKVKKEVEKQKKDKASPPAKVKSSGSSSVPAKKEGGKVKKEKDLSKGHKSISGFFQKIEKKAEPVVHYVSDFARYFRPFTPKPTVVIAPTNVFQRSVNADSFLDSVNSIDNPEIVQNDFKEFCNRDNLVLAKVLRPNTLDGIVPLRVWRFLRFAEDVRPPYFGSWTKSSNLVKGKKPFVMDSSILDYDFDSEAEWEEEEPGEDLISEVDDEEKDVPEEGEEEGWVVPHGYLSDDEGEPEADAEVGGEPSTKSKGKILKPKIIQLLIPVILGPSYSFDNIPLELMVEFIHDVSNPFDTLYLEKRKAPPKKSLLSPEMVVTLSAFIEANDSLKLKELVEGFLLHCETCTLSKSSIETEVRLLAKSSSKGWTLKSGSSAVVATKDTIDDTAAPPQSGDADLPQDECDHTIMMIDESKQPVTLQS